MPSVDALDLQILATMGYTPWGRRPRGVDALRPSTIAKVVDVTAETVSERLRHMEATGVIDGYQAYPNPRHGELEIAAWAFHPPSEAVLQGALEEMALVDGVAEIMEFHGGLVVVVLCWRSESERQRRLDLVSRMLEDPSPARVFEPPLPDPTRELTHLDWRIVRALRGHADRSLQEVAEEVGVSYRTVKRRFDRMIEEGSLFVVPRVDRSRVTGVIPFTLFAVLGPDAPEDLANALKGRFAERLVHTMIPREPGTGRVGIGLWAQSLAEVEVIRQEALGIEGVDRVWTVFPRARHETSWLDGVIQERVQATASP